MTTARLNVLFVCSHNHWRSPTAERVWRNTPSLNVRFAGTSRRARRALRHDDIAWADVILVIEEKHKSRGLAEYRQTASAKEIHVLDIPDNSNSWIGNLSKYCARNARRSSSTVGVRL
jgi:predicted protein tyrosine phosphatase